MGEGLGGKLVTSLLWNKLPSHKIGDREKGNITCDASTLCRKCREIIRKRMYVGVGLVANLLKKTVCPRLGLHLRLYAIE